MPYLAEVYFAYYKIEVDPYREGELGFYQRGNDGERTWWRFSQLYADKNKAKRALLDLQKEKLAHWQLEVAALEQELS